MLDHAHVQALEHQASVGGAAEASIIVLPAAGVLLGGFYGMRTFGENSVVAGFLGGAVGAYVGLLAGIWGALAFVKAFGGDGPAIS